MSCKREGESKPVRPREVARSVLSESGDSIERRAGNGEEVRARIRCGQVPRGQKSVAWHVSMHVLDFNQCLEIYNADLLVLF